ncbi:MAG: hypothetical protein DRG82_11615 [Deltaproteobacteria bacterium]|nr:MAG: hypothetical protein DRG82_11615 [Deltaproteobacteria bacterium]
MFSPFAPERRSTMPVTYEVRNIMTEDLITVDADAPLMQAMKKMVEKNIGSVIVSRGDRPVGIVTERDILKDFCVNPRSGESRIADIMSSPLITIDAGTSLGRAADLMAEKKIRRLLVTEDDMIKGIVTERDIMRATLYVFKTLSDAWI